MAIRDIYYQSARLELAVKCAYRFLPAVVLTVFCRRLCHIAGRLTVHARLLRGVADRQQAAKIIIFYEEQQNIQLKYQLLLIKMPP